MDKSVSRISLLMEGYPRIGFQVYSRILESGWDGVCITRLHPEYVQQKHGLNNTECFWLSGRKGKGTISPKTLSQLVKVVRTEAKGKDGALVFLDGLEYLLMYNDITKVMDALKEIDRNLARSNGEMIICIDPLTLEKRDVERLWECYEKYDAAEAESVFTQQFQQISSAVPRSEGQKAEGLVG